MAHDEAYYEAEKKIEAARRSDATNLNLSKIGLTELPGTIGHFTHLLKLNVGGNPWNDEKNQLTTLPESPG
jgi:hypothetical protein